MVIIEKQKNQDGCDIEMQHKITDEWYPIRILLWCISV